MTLVVDHDIIRFQITVYYVVRVKSTKCNQNLRAVKGHPPAPSACLLLAQDEIMLILQHPKQVLTSQVFKHETNVLIVCKCVI